MTCNFSADKMGDHELRNSFPLGIIYQKKVEIETILQSSVIKIDPGNFESSFRILMKIIDGLLES